MVTEKIALPDFKSEATEAQWWFDHQDEITDLFEQAAEDGTLLTGEAAKVKALPTTTIRLDPADIQLARTQAEKRGLKYQTYLKMVLHEALLREQAGSSLATPTSTAA